MHPVLPGGPVTLATPRLKVCLRARGGQLLPRYLETRAGFVERLGNLKPNGDYLTVRANCLENNIVLWKFENGKRSSPRPRHGSGTTSRSA